MTRRTGFTIVELTVAITLASMMVLALLTVVRQPHMSVQRSRQVGVVASFDRAARRRARLDRTAHTLEYDIDRNELRLYRDGELVMERLRLSYGVSVEALWTGGRQPIRSGRVPIRLDRWGGSKSYGVELRWPGDVPRRILFAGVSGRAEEIERSEEIPRVLRELETSGNDVD